jgi:ubiquinone/menaquinone biosynthesis C-methylase UbiE
MSQQLELSQFGKPTDVQGEQVGQLMANSNGPINSWTISLLGIRANDSVLEIGFGPGVAIQELTQISLARFIAGIDHSEVMIAQAGTRNARAIQDGRVELRLGSASALPYQDTTFDKVFSVNSFQFWPEPLATLAEIRRTMKPNGLIAITIQPRWAMSEVMVDEVGDQLRQGLSTAGFGSIKIEKKELEPMSAVCALGCQR